MRGGQRWGLACSLVAIGLVAAACTDDATAPPASDEGPEAAAAVTTLCESVRDLHNEMIDAANTMSGLEVGAEPEERAVILADGLDRIIDIAESAELPTTPPELVVGLPERRRVIVADLRVEAEAFRHRWRKVEQDQRREAVNAIFLLTEKAMSETEPRITSDTPAFLVDAARQESACQFVLQLPIGG